MSSQRSGFLSTGELSREVGNGFRAALYRVAVMSQVGDDAADLGQPLPTGSLEGVSCRQPAAAAAGPRISACTARWETVDGRRSVTRYEVRLDEHRCFFAQARPVLAPRFDATARTYSENPLNSLTSLRRGC